MIEILKKVNKTTSRETSVHAVMKLTTLVVLLFGSISLIQAAPETPYKRPINKDCVSISRSEASLFPEQFWLDGDSRTSQDVVTTVCFLLFVLVDRVYARVCIVFSSVNN